MRARVRRTAAVVLATIGFASAAAAPAQAHTVHVGVDPSNWRSRITAVEPAGPGYAVTLGDGAQRVCVTVTGAATVIVLGLAGEPFVRITRAGAWVNDRSTTRWVVAGPATPSPSDVDDQAAPRWTRVSHTGSWTWHDTRTHWPGFTPPPQVEHDPDRRQVVATWQLPITVDGRPGVVSGDLQWVPGPSATPGLAFLLVPLVGLLAIGVARRWRGAAVAALVLLTAGDVVHAGGLVAGRVGDGWARLAALPGHGTVSVALWVAMLACAVALARRRHVTAAVYGAAMVAAVVFLTEGVPSVALVWHSQAITGLPVGVDRYLVAALTGGSLGLLVAAVLVIRRLDRRPPSPRPLAPVAA